MSKPDFAPSFLRGVAHFNAGEFWHAHEAWEELWLESESRLVDFLQGLIQLTAAYHHAKRGTLRGAARLFDAALQKLEAFDSDYCGLDRSQAIAAAARHRGWAQRRIAAGEMVPLSPEEFPSLHLLTTPESFAPPETGW